MPVVRPNQPLNAQCRFNVGGPADFFVTVSDGDEMFTAFEFAFDRKLTPFVYSGGSNLFFDDAGFRGVVIRLKGGSWELEKRDLLPELTHYEGRDSVGLNHPTDDLNGASTPAAAAAEHDDLDDFLLGREESEPAADRLAATSVVKVSGGFELGRLVRELARLDLGGIEFLGNIPGSVAGAVVGNAGCYGHAIAEVLVDATLYSTLSHETQVIGPDFFDFRYRHSKLKNDSPYYVVGATLRLTQRPRSEVLGDVEAELAERLRKHPHDAACAGSFFQNPSRDRPAWKLITEAGLAGHSIGGAQFSPKHANFLINAGGASSTDILRLARLAQKTVLEETGFELVPEVRYVSPQGVVEPLPDL